MCFSSVLYVPIAVTNVRVRRPAWAKLELMHFCRIITVFMHLQVCWFLVFRIFYSLLPTLRDWKLMGVSNRPTLVNYKLMRNFCRAMLGVMTKTPMVCSGAATVLKNHKIINQARFIMLQLWQLFLICVGIIYRHSSTDFLTALHSHFCSLKRNA